MPGSVYEAARTAAPGFGKYSPEEFAAKVRGAVKLQAAIRRRQSRELFRSVEAHARSVRELTPTLTSTLSADIDADARR